MSVLFLNLIELFKSQQMLVEELLCTFELQEAVTCTQNV